MNIVFRFILTLSVTIAASSCFRVCASGDTPPTTQPSFRHFSDDEMKKYQIIVRDELPTFYEIHYKYGTVDRLPHVLTCAGGALPVLKQRTKHWTIHCNDRAVLQIGDEL